MGGTTAKVGLVRGGTPQVTRQYHVGAVAQPGAGAARGSGYPIRTPVIELAEIGAGGGSIAWVDTGGALRVGPVSAGAEPGPASYGQGGTEPTVTDANLVLGRLSAESFLGGELHLDVDAARRAIRERCADPLGLDVVTAAFGIVEIANAAMASALRLMSVQRGLDPRGFGLVGFGGAGPVHVNRLAAEMGIVRTIVPPSPGTFSALGLLMNDLRHEYSQTFLRRTASADVAAIRETFARLEADGRAMLRREGVDDADVVVERHAEMQYVGQSYVLPIALPQGSLEPDDLAAAERDFHAAHERAYGFAAPAEPTEIVNLRLATIGRIPAWVPNTIAREAPAGAAEGRSGRLFRRGGRLYADADLRARALPRGDRPDRPGHRRGDGLDDGHPSRLFGPSRPLGQPGDRAGWRGGTSMRLAAMGILHETNTFSTSPTDDEAFEHSTISGARGDLLGEKVWEVYGPTGITIAGYMDADALPGVDVVPIGLRQHAPGRDMAGRDLRADRGRTARAPGCRGAVRWRADGPARRDGGRGLSRRRCRVHPPGSDDRGSPGADRQRHGHPRQRLAGAGPCRRHHAPVADQSAHGLPRPRSRVRAADRADGPRRDRARAGGHQPADGGQHPRAEHRRPADARRSWTRPRHSPRRCPAFSTRASARDSRTRTSLTWGWRWSPWRTAT